MEWYQIILLVLAGVIILYFLVFFILTIVIVHFFTHPRCVPFEVAYNRALNLKKFTEDEYKNYYQMEEFNITSKDGYNLKAVYMPKQGNVEFEDNRERVVIIVHGWTSCRVQMLGYAKIYLKAGFHVFTYDQRNHLDSDKVITTMGDKEADDLQTVIEIAKQRIGEDIVVGTHGESMGAATVMIHAGRYHNVDFLVEDCGYNTLKELLTYQCKNYKKFPTFPTIFFNSILFKVFTKTSFKDVMPVEQIAKCEDIPMCFMHGEKDDFVPTYMIYKLYDNKPGYKEMHVYKDSIHARSYVDYKEEYEQDVLKFLRNTKIISLN